MAGEKGGEKKKKEKDIHLKTDKEKKICEQK